MDTGTKVSGIGHGLLILWALVGGLLPSAREPELETVDVSVITAEEFAALTPGPVPPVAVTEVPEPAEPETSPAPEVSPRPEAAPERPDPPVTEAPRPDPTPAPPEPLVPDVPVESEAPESPEPPAPPPGAGLDTPDPDPTPQEAPRVAPTPAPAPPPDAAVAETPSPATDPEAEAPAVEEDQPEAAPEEATTEIVTEAERPSGAVSASPRPVTRPPPPAATAETEPEPAPATDPLADAVADAVAEAVANPDPAPARPTGPPLTQGERDALRVAVETCWNVGSLSSAALATTVVVGVEMLENGRPNIESIRLIEFSGGDEGAARQAFEAARRAIIRCGANGYDLPPEKYAQWRDVEMTFNPERMRIR